MEELERTVLHETIPLQDLERDEAALVEELSRALTDVRTARRWILGPHVERFEAAMGEYASVRHAVGVASGTDALLLALDGLGIGAGDEVITSSFTFFATASAIVHAGADPVFADILPDTFDLDPAAVEAAVTPRTAALLPVHLFGQMADMGALAAIGAKHGLAVIEDAAQAIGARQRTSGGRAAARAGGAGRAVVAGRGSAEDPGERAELRAGAAGDAGCFSFYPTKNLGGWGDGGMVTTNDDAVAERVRALRVHGRTGEAYRHELMGYNSRLDSLQAAVLDVKLSYLDRWNERRRAHAAAYDAALADVADVRTPAVRPGNVHTYHQYTIRCADRERLARRLTEAGIGHGIYYREPLHLQEALADLGGRRGDFPQAERAADEVLSLPVFPGLRPEERERVVAAIRAGGA